MTDDVLSAALPGHWSPLQRTKNHVLYVLARIAFACIRAVPRQVAIPLARAVGALAFWLVLPQRRTTCEHLALAFPELTPRQRRRLGRRCFAHLAVSAMELAHLEHFARTPLPRQAHAVFEDALGAGRGVVAVTGHIGNWELLAQVLARANLDMATIAKPLYDPRLTRWVHKMRSRDGLEIIWRGGRGASNSKDMLRVFRRGGILALLIDQDTRVQGDFVPFFGHPAFTPTAAAALALRMNAPVVAGWIHRHGGQHHIHFEPVAKPESSGDRRSDTLALTASITERLEAAIREHPEQWVWMHRRWRTRPEHADGVPVPAE